MKNLTKIVLSIFILMTITFVAIAQQTMKVVNITARDSSAHHFTLNGAVPTSLNGQKIHLIIYKYDSWHDVEKSYSTIVKDGSFTFNGSTQMPVAKGKVYVFNDQGKLIGNTTMVLEAKNNQFIATQTSPKDPLSENILSKAHILNSNGNYIMHLMDSVETASEKEVPYSAEREYKMVNSELKILSRYPNEYFSLLKLYYIANRLDMKGQKEDLPLKVFNSFSPTLKNSDLGKTFLKETTVLRYGGVLATAGKPAQQFSVMTDKGTMFNTATLKGSPYVVAFSATWCGQCQIHQPVLLDLYHKYRAKGLKVVYFNLDKTVDRWKKMISDKKLDWTNVSERTVAEESKISKQFAVYSLPKYFVVDREGKIVYVDDSLKDDELEKYIKQVVM